jgi:hypothetical protein
VTLILTTISHHGIVQVVDRLVTRRTQSGLDRFDPRANKNVLLAAKDALVTISYTGLAYLDDLPTDEWLVQTVLRRPIPRGPDGVRPAAIVFDSPSTWPSIGEVVEGLAGSVAAAFARLTPKSWQDSPLTIFGAGWQLYRKKRPRPIAFTVSKQEGVAPVTIDRLPRHIGSRVYLSALPDGQISREEHRALLQEIVNSPPSHSDRIMVSFLREISKRETTVGDQVTCVQIGHPREGVARVRYDSLVEDRVQLTMARGSLTVPVAFTPWIVTRGLSAAPAVLGGSATTQLDIGPWTLDLGGGPPSHNTGLIGLHSSQMRPRRPSQ